MYCINKRANNVIRIEKSSFCEQEHPHEWITKLLDRICEDQELLIIQKEFDGFDQSPQHLEILALDKNGDLVIVENNLNDSKNDVMNRILKYTAYCSTLSTLQVIEIYQDYLNFYSNEEDARSNIMKFMDEGNSELQLNKNDQGIIIVAERSRKDVIYTALWLLEHSINIKCLRVTTFKSNDVILFHVEQIIPLSETQQFLIDMNDKEKNVVN